MCRLSLVVLLFFSLVAPSGAAPLVTSMSGIVRSVSDGDTFKLLDGHGQLHTVRLYGVDAPELERRSNRTGRLSKVGQPYGEEAFLALKELLLHKEVRLEVRAVDRYRRLVALVYQGDQPINRLMVQQGLAWAYRQYLDRPHASIFLADEELARHKKLGLWRQANPQPPWEFRRRSRSHHSFIRCLYNA